MPRGNGFKLAEDRFRLEFVKKIFTVRLVRHWNRMPGEVSDAPFLKVFKTKMEMVLSNLVWQRVSLPMAEGSELDNLRSLPPEIIL